LVVLEPFPALEPFPDCAETGVEPSNTELVNAPKANKEVEIFKFMLIT
jgi:hypothetical protein